MTDAPVELRIERWSKTGEGIATFQGRAVFVAGAMPGEHVRARIQGDGVLRAEVLEFLATAPARRAPACPLADRCGGCDWLHVDDAEQRRAKEAIVVSTLERLGGIPSTDYALEPFVVSQPMGTRRRAVLHPVKGALGFFGRRSHELVAVQRCPALTPKLEALPGPLADVLAGVLKDLREVRLLEAGGLVAASLHLKDRARPKHEAAAQAARDRGLVDAVVLVAETGGPPVSVGDVALPDDGLLSRPDGFAQANRPVNAQLVDAVVAWMAPGASDEVLELYAGNGNFTFPLARQARSVTAVESTPVSVALAQAVARRDAVSNVRFVQADAAAVVKGFVAEHKRFDQLLVDPPRAGCAGVGGWAARLLVRQVVYVACDPASLARDAAELASHGYRPSKLRLFDLFPQTHHVEAVMAFARDQGAA